MSTETEISKIEELQQAVALREKKAIENVADDNYVFRVKDVGAARFVPSDHKLKNASTLSAKVDSLEFSHPQAPYGAEESQSTISIVQIFHPSEKKDSRILKAVKSGSGRFWYDSYITEVFSFPAFFTTFITASIWWFSKASPFLMDILDPFFGFNPRISVLFSVAFLLTFLLISLEIATITRKLIDQPERKFRSITDENSNLFFIGKNSAVFKMLSISDEVTELVRQKMLTEPDGEEMNAWCSKVKEILDVQTSLKDGFPMNYIPLMSDDAETVVQDLKGQVSRVRLQKIENDREKALAIEAGMVSSGLSSSAVNESKSVLEGASSFLSGITIDDVTHG